ncbi:Cysteine desulfurase [Candidatus Portiera aleyrodidarum]|uniref:Cysteine desulfurase n=1 Tax=Candidatus Portiera aleyrodidarum TV TaxID=1297582 RepID=A0A8D3X856_9GAMM|nr:cysteine desulfurase [Candidatus Portiera aleyrodidarum]AGI27164.1 cysteine desulfurase-like protein, SufS subfamily [Candidatus Portiera aleyrodidarum TV]CEI59142.1 Cysteine desulfurase [Candidatus Portiera aleyrodidarum]
MLINYIKIQKKIIKIRKDFPVLKKIIYKIYSLIYLDNAATIQMPTNVIKIMKEYNKYYNANIHRGVNYLSNEATIAYERTRTMVCKFINAKYKEEVIFTKGTTESINLVSNSYGKVLKKGSEILISMMEHHSNIIPWKILSKNKGVKLKIIPVNEQGLIDIKQLKKLVTKKTKLVVITHVSNVLGTTNPIKSLSKIVHKKKALILIDGAQSISHKTIDVQKLNIDFYVCSSHKSYGPTGLGILYIRLDILKQLDPWQYGGDMVKYFSFFKEKIIYSELPYKFEAGTQAICNIIAYYSSLKWLKKNLHFIKIWEKILVYYIIKKLKKIKQIHIIGKNKKISVVSFIIEGINSHDIGLLLDQYGIAIRTGNHCVQPILNNYGINSVCRISFAIYNKLDEIKKFIMIIKKLLKIF